MLTPVAEAVLNGGDVEADPYCVAPGPGLD